MTDIYSDLKSVASDLLTEFKQGVVKYIEQTPGTGPTYNPGEPTTVETTFPGATVGNVSRRYVDGTRVVQTDLMVTAGVVAGLSPSEKGRISVDGITYEIISFLPIPPAGTPVVWKFIIRK